jgi:hypothetical protein
MIVNGYTGARRSLLDRMRAAAFLDISAYEEVEADTTATSQAAIVVGIVAICAAVGGHRNGVNGVIAGAIAAYLGWLLWSGINYLIGTRLFKGTATWGELLRTVGFAQSPGVLFIFGFLPLIGGLIKAAVAIWMLIATVIAIRQALDIDTTKAVITAIIGFFCYLIASVVVFHLAGIPPRLI